MAKSLRAKDKLAARNMLRKKVFEPVEKQKLLEVAAKLHAEKKATMEVDEEKPKVSTTGWKGSRNDNFKQKGGKRNKKTKNTLVFSKGKFKK